MQEVSQGESLYPVLLQEEVEEGLDSKASQQRQRERGWETPHQPGWLLTVLLPPSKKPSHSPC